MGQKDLTGKNFMLYNEKLHVYRMSHLPKQVRNRFHSDMWIVVDYLAEKHNYKPSMQKISHPEALLLMLEALSESLLNLNRIDDLRKAAASKQYRNKLYKQFGIV